MSPRPESKTRPLRRAAACALAVAGMVQIVGCASNRLDAQWVDPQHAAAPLRGSRILVACSAYEAVLQRICQDQFSAEITARGATPVLPPATSEAPAAAASAAPVAATAPDAVLQQARSSGAKAVLTAVITTAVSQVGSGVSIGIGGFGFGRGGGGGIGVSAPIGGGQVASGYSASGRLLDAADGRLMWTAQATTPPSGDATAQLAELAKTLLDAAEKSGVL